MTTATIAVRESTGLEKILCSIFQLYYSFFMHKSKKTILLTLHMYNYIKTEISYFSTVTNIMLFLQLKFETFIGNQEFYTR